VSESSNEAKAVWTTGACAISDWQHHLLDHSKEGKFSTHCQAQVHVQSVTGSITSLIILSRANSAHTVLPLPVGAATSTLSSRLYSTLKV